MDTIHTSLPSVTVDLSFLHLVVSQLCHDLVSPIGAVNNGVELIEELGSTPDSEAFNLIAQSGQAAAAKLQCFRLAWGRGGASSDTRLADVRQVLIDYFAGETRIGLNWPADAAAEGVDYAPGALQLLMNSVLAVATTLTRGGQISVRMQITDNGAPFEIDAEGQNLRVPDVLPELLAGRVRTPLDHRTVAAGFASLLGRALGVPLTISQPSTELVRIAGRLPILSFP
ncbi:MAG: histidine phosphotransferase family protein [Elstera sp.]